MYHTYIIYSKKLNRYYVGHSEDLNIRIQQHNTGISEYTSKAEDWILVYSESFDTRELARDREFAIKRKKSRKYIEWLTNQKN